jgi:hypothetical protein
VQAREATGKLMVTMTRNKIMFFRVLITLPSICSVNLN